jgi:hypothetical protein
MRLVSALLVILAFSSLCYAQAGQRPIRRDVAVDLKVSIFGGAGTVVDSDHAKGAVQFGGALELTVPNTFFGFQLEGGYVGPSSHMSRGSGVVSANYKPSWTITPCVEGACVVGFATAGYTYLVGTANAINFGGGLEYFFPKRPQGIRVEVRDYANFTGPGEHNIALRLGWIVAFGD